MRLDADEVVSPSLAREIAEQLPRLADDIEGVTIGRRMSFMGRPIRHGGVFPIRVLRIFRHGAGRCEDRWMDEHIKVSGPVARLKGEILDDNLNSLSWWTAKHNSYASREVVDLLNLKHGFMTHDSVAGLAGGQAGVKCGLSPISSGVTSCGLAFLMGAKDLLSMSCKDFGIASLSMQNWRKPQRI
jgi:hypothetical protein